MATVKILITDEFSKNAKRLLKKYPSFENDLRLFKQELTSGINVGIPLGSGIRKVRISIESKGKGKSGGARAITYDIVIQKSEKAILLVTVFDKNERDSISINAIKAIIKKAQY